MKMLLLRGLITANVVLAVTLLAPDARAMDEDKKGTCQSEVGTNNKYCCLSCMLVEKNCDTSEECKPKET